MFFFKCDPKQDVNSSFHYVYLPCDEIFMLQNYGTLESDVMALMNLFFLFWNTSMFYVPTKTFKFFWGPETSEYVSLF